jgi:dihydrofolate reductase
MPRPYRIEGYAIVSVDGMIADAAGVMPDSLKNDADQTMFSAGLDRADVLVHGRHSHEGHPNLPRRQRLIATRGVATLAPDPTNAKALLWNPAGASLEAACRALGIDEGTVAVIGGTEIFGLFLGLGYEAFHLTRASKARLPSGRPVFPGVPERTPEAVLESRGLRPGPERVLDAAAGVTLVDWERRA